MGDVRNREDRRGKLFFPHAPKIHPKNAAGSGHFQRMDRNTGQSAGSIGYRTSKTDIHGRRTRIQEVQQVILRRPVALGIREPVPGDVYTRSPIGGLGEHAWAVGIQDWRGPLQSGRERPLGQTRKGWVLTADPRAGDAADRIYALGNPMMHPSVEPTTQRQIGISRWRKCGGWLKHRWAGEPHRYTAPLKPLPQCDERRDIPPGANGHQEGSS